MFSAQEAMLSSLGPFIKDMMNHFQSHSSTNNAMLLMACVRILFSSGAPHRAPGGSICPAVRPYVIVYCNQPPSDTPAL